MSKNLRRDFNSRAELVSYLKAEFSHTINNGGHVAQTRGGREAALNALHSAKLDRYDRTRNFLDGDVTRLSPYLRHGVLSLAEVRDYAYDNRAPAKFINELGWRDYYQRVYAKMGRNIWQDCEPYKTGFSAETYAPTLPEDIKTGTTGTCIDIFCRELIETGYLHNHARMWLAAYIVHWRRVRWQAGARWFLEHLLDGDPASNNLSFQWVASTFSHKPYFMNADNIRKFAKGKHPQLMQGRLEPFEGTYPALEAKLFPNKPPEVRHNQRKPRTKQKRGGRR